jgi:hypothetical protein
LRSPLPVADDEVELLQEELMRGELFGKYFYYGDWHQVHHERWPAKS